MRILSRILLNPHPIPHNNGDSNLRERTVTTHEKLIALLDQHQARYRLMEHEATEM